MLVFRILLSALLIAAALCAAAVAVAAQPAAGHATVGAERSVALRSSAVSQLSLANMAIGDQREGITAVKNAGSGAATVFLQADVAGGRALTRQLQVSVVERRAGGARAKIYEGPLAELGSVEVAGFAKGEQRTYAFVVRLASTGTSDGDNALQGLNAQLTVKAVGVQSGPR